MPAQQPILTAQFVDELKHHPALPQGSWYVISAAVLCALNCPNEVAELFKYAIEGEPDTAAQQRVAERLREALIKVIPVSGMPKVSSISTSVIS